MDVPPGVACLDTRHPRRLLAPEQVLMRFSIYDRPSPMTDPHLSISKLSWSGIIFAIPAKKRCRYAPKLDPTEAACHCLPLYGEYPMSCGSSSNRSSKSTMRQSAPVVRA